MTYHRRLAAKPPAKKCKQCGKEPAIFGRPDGLGLSCGTHKDRGVEKAVKFAKEHQR
jgi:ribosomal protein L32